MPLTRITSKQITHRYNQSTPARGLELKLMESISIMDFGAAGDGVTDDTAALLAAVNALGNAGGTVHIPTGVKILIDVGITIPANVSIVGPHNFVGTPGDNSSAPYDQLGGAIILNPAHTITLSSGTSLCGLLIYRKGMSFPESTSAAFAGTALTVGGDDVTVERSLVLGFTQAFISVGYQRQRLDTLCFDCTNGIHIESSLDNPLLSNCHGWPYASIATVSKPSNWADRTGVAYYLKTVADWTTLFSCFSYGYRRGTKVENVNHYVLLCPQHDGTGGYTSSIGIEIDCLTGGGEEGLIIAPRIAAQGTAGIRVANSSGVATTILGGGLWATGTHGILLSSGDLHITNTVLRSMANGITVDNATSRVVRHGVRFKSVTQPLNITTPNSTLFGNTDDMVNLADGTPIAGANMIVKAIASADPVNLPASGDFFSITGTTNFGTLNGGWAGRKVTLKFTDALTIFDGGSSIKLTSNFTSAANSTLTLIHDGVAWLETGRSIN